MVLTFLAGLSVGIPVGAFLYAVICTTKPVDTLTREEGWR